ncbi:YhcH/YjgK/YiaL family protein [Cricetibacter osteomyelitidis]|uniref:YhcH/YjgK/YiaL family protein n=1 Tax=Cricetibacter osteomyelitidis TaxID=1521931 RepID=A0A4V2T264_9PAST|nr:YhcH/YjgK/YiaL family protein [Cricetibacter osteomyelitidis]TCP96263.1 YhcH/YjgK/YiaL family protein [Cricetibacter osteomyelitidis]
MFFGHISKINPNQYPTAILQALEYLRSTDFDTLDAGCYSIKGDSVYVQVLDLETKPKSSYQPEVHRRYLDVQYLHSGKERIGVATDLGNNKIAMDYNPERDILYYEDVAFECELVMQPGAFAVFFPEDIHRAACIDSEPSKIRKVVVKIAMTELED